MPAVGADADAIAEWRAQHEAWRVSHAEWKSGQAEADRAARARAAAENKARAQELTAQAEAARAARRASRPRTSAAYVVTVLGVALIGGAIAALRALSVPDTADFAIPIAFAVATLAIAAGMLIAALRRRRSGVPRLHRDRVHGRDAHRHRGGVDHAAGRPRAARLRHPARPLATARAAVRRRLHVRPPDRRRRHPVVELTQGTGDTWLTIDENARVALDATDAGTVNVVSVDADGTMTQVEVDADRPMLLGGDQVVAYTGSNAADVRLELHQSAGSVHIEIHEGE